MFRRKFLVLIFLSGFAARISAAPTAPPLEQRGWYEIRTAHFNIPSCGDTVAVVKLAGRLEQFCCAD